MKTKLSNQISAKIKSRITQMEDKVPLVLFRIGKSVIDEVRTGMKEPKSGRTYATRVGRGGRNLQRPRIHTASAKGEYPAIHTGGLINSLGFEAKGNELKIGTSKPYAKHLINSGRKLFKEGYNENKDEISNIIKETLEFNQK